MVIIKIMGGFASQVYKFFLGAKLAEYLQTELVLDISDYYDGYFRPYSLNLLNIPVFQTVCTREIEKKYPRLFMVRNSDDMENMVKHRRKGDYYIFREETDYAHFFEKYPEFEVDAATPYIKTLDLKTSSPFINDFLKSITQHTSVAIHIRRGDFVTLGQESKIAYFHAAIVWFYERDPGTQFYFFSNDLEWVKDQFGFNTQFHYIHAQDDKTGDIEELFCMSYCNYRILSSYSGYGLLANTLAAVRNADSFALIKEKKDGEYIHKEIEGSIQYLTEEQIEKYEPKYSGICWEKQGKDLLQQENAAELPQKEAVKIKENYFIITCERYSKWFRRGMFEIAVRLAQKGCTVSYVNLFDCLEKGQIETETACNMDGVEYGFHIIRGSLAEIEKLVKKMQGVTIVCDCKLPFCLEENISLIRLQSRKAELCQKKWTRVLFRAGFIAGMSYAVRKRQSEQHTITLLDNYWEDTLMQNGKSDVDVTEIFKQVYEEAAEEVLKNAEGEF